MLKFRIDRRIIFQGIFQETSMDLVGSPVFPDVPGRCRLKVVSNGDSDRGGGGGGDELTHARGKIRIFGAPLASRLLGISRTHVCLFARPTIAVAKIRD